MNQWRDAMITRQAQELHMVVEGNQWTLGGPTTISKMENQSVSTAINTDIWRRTAEERRKNKKQENASNTIKRGILQRTARESR